MILPKQYNTKQSFTSVKTSFVSRGITCAATLRKPDNSQGRLPAILMVHGWGGVQEALTPPFYKEFIKSGFAVMTFDYPGWGESEGLLRNDIKAKHRVQDADAALCHLKSLPDIDSSKIVLWGSSFGGGHVVDLAAMHHDLLGAIAQVPMLNGLLAVRAVPFIRLMRFSVYVVADIIKPGKPVYLPIISKPGEFGTMDRDDAFKALSLSIEATKIEYDNRITARSLLTMGPYQPYRRLKDVKVPFLIIGGTRDTVAPFDEEAIRRVGNKKIQIHTVDANHFEPYFDPVFSTSVSIQLSFLDSLSDRSQGKKI